jgi:hypothetical protein
MEFLYYRKSGFLFPLGTLSKNSCMFSFVLIYFKTLHEPCRYSVHLEVLVKD